MPKTPMTQRRAELLREELHRLKTVERPANSAAIGEARAHGDLSENAEYHAARERAGFIEGRISELESKLANAQVIEPRPGGAGGGWAAPAGAACSAPSSTSRTARDRPRPGRSSARTRPTSSRTASRSA